MKKLFKFFVSVSCKKEDKKEIENLIQCEKELEEGKKEKFIKQFIYMLKMYYQYQIIHIIYNI